METKKPPTPKTIEKYGIQFDDKKRVIIPADLRRPIVKMDMAPKKVSAQESVEYLLKNRIINGEPPKPDIAKRYKQFGSIIKIAGGDEENVIPTLENPEKILEALKSKYANKETLRQKWQTLSTHVNYSNLDLDSDLKHKYSIILKNLKDESDESTDAKNKSIKVYRWDYILDAIEKTFGKNSLENFFFRMFNEIPIRSEFEGMPIIHKGDDTVDKPNFVLDSGGHNIELHLRQWKTKGDQYPDEIVYKFSPELCDIFRRTEHPRSVLIPVKHLNKWILESLEKAGFPNFPYGSKDSPLKDVPSGLRRTIATFRNSTYNTDSPRGAELAGLMLHSHDKSVTTYRHTSFIQ